jgi:hypothetical protein
VLKGENCSDPELLVFSGGIASATGTTTGYADDYASDHCSAGTGTPDRVYQFTLPVTSNVTAKLTPFGPSSLVSLHSGLVTGCEEASTLIYERACGVATTSVARAAAAELGAGTYYIWVDGESEAGSYSLDVKQVPVVTDGRCATPIALSFTNGKAVVSGTTADGINYIDNTCSGSGPEKVYTFKQSRVGRVTATVTGSGDYRPVLNVLPTCDPATQNELGCNMADVGSNSTTVNVDSVPVGDYFLIVDGADGTSGDFELTVTQTDPDGDTCANPVLITPGTVTGTTVGYNNDISPGYLDTACSSSVVTGLYDGPDRVYSIVVPAGKKLTASVTPINPTPTANPALYIIQDPSFCAKRPTSCVGSDNAANGGTETVSYTAGGTTDATFFIVVDDGSAYESYRFSLTTTIQ